MWSVPVSSDLVAVAFPTPQQGWAVGHDGVILASADVQRVVDRIAHQILEKTQGAADTVLLGNRCLQRVISIARVSTWRQGVLSVPRITSAAIT